MTKRKRHTAGFKAKVALEAIRGELTTAGALEAIRGELTTAGALEAIRGELTTAGPARKYDIHPTMIAGWKKAAIETMASASDGRMPAQPRISGKAVERLHARIARRVVERGFPAPPVHAGMHCRAVDASGLIPGTGGRRR